MTVGDAPDFQMVYWKWESEKVFCLAAPIIQLLFIIMVLIVGPRSQQVVASVAIGTKPSRVRFHPGNTSDDYAYGRGALV